MKKLNKDWIYRFSIPGKYDHAPQGTICSVPMTKTEFEIYCQTSEEEDYPTWGFVAEFSTGLPNDYISNEINRIIKVEYGIESVNKVQEKQLKFKGAKNEHK